MGVKGKHSQRNAPKAKGTPSKRKGGGGHQGLNSQRNLQVFKKKEGGVIEKIGFMYFERRKTKR